MGLRYVKGLREDEGKRIEEIVREEAAFDSLDKFVARTQTNGVTFWFRGMPFDMLWRIRHVY